MEALQCALCAVDQDLEFCRDCDEVLCHNCGEENACPFEGESLADKVMKEPPTRDQVRAHVHGNS